MKLDETMQLASNKRSFLQVYGCKALSSLFFLYVSDLVAGDRKWDVLELLTPSHRT